MKQLEFATDEIIRVVELGFQNLLEQIEEPQDKTTLRKLSKNYDKLSVEDIAAVLAASGQKPGQEPNEVSQLIARKELELREE
jgi:hypothetical protein